MKFIVRWLTNLYAWACQRLYNEFAGSYDLVSWLVSGGRWSTWRRCALTPLVSEHPPQQQPLRILEIGFGTGALLAELTELGLTVYGLELSPAMHRVATRRFNRQGVNPPRLCGQAQSLPFADGSFDVIVSTFPANYILDQATLNECARLLERSEATMGRAGGCLLIVGMWVAIQPQWLGRLLPLFYSAPSPTGLTWMEQQLAAAGLQAEFSDCVDGPFRISTITAYKI